MCSVQNFFSHSDRELQPDVTVVAAQDVPPGVQLWIGNAEWQIVEERARELIGQPAGQRDENRHDVVPAQTVPIVGGEES